MVKMKCKVCGAEWNETYPPSAPSYGVCPAGKNCTTLVESRKTGEVVSD